MLSPVRIVAVVILTLLLLTGTATIALIIRAGSSSGPGIILYYKPEHAGLSLEQACEIAKKRLEGYRAAVSVAEPNRIAVRIPYPQNVHETTTAFTEALENFRKALPTRSAMKYAVEYTGNDRDAVIGEIAQPGTALHDALIDLSKARDALEAVRRKFDTSTTGEVPDAVREERAVAARNLDTAHTQLAANILEGSALLEMLDAAAGDDRTPLRAQVDSLPERYPTQASAIRPVLSAWRNWLAAGGPAYLRPDQVDDLLIGGELSFRIAVTASDLGGIDSRTYRSAIEELQISSPLRTIPALGFSALWFDHSRHGFPSPPLVIAYYYGTPCVLCYNDRRHIILGNDPFNLNSLERWTLWSVHAGPVSQDSSGNITLPFTLEQRGAQDLANLADIFKGQPLIISLDSHAQALATLSPAFAEHPTIPFGTPTADRPEIALRRQAFRVQHILSGNTKLPLRRVE